MHGRGKAIEEISLEIARSHHAWLEAQSWAIKKILDNKRTADNTEDGYFQEIQRELEGARRVAERFLGDLEKEVARLRRGGGL